MRFKKRLLGLLVVLLLVITVSSVSASSGPDWQKFCEDRLGGVYVPMAPTAMCYNVPVRIGRPSYHLCPDDSHISLLMSFGSGPLSYTCGYHNFPSFADEGRCKFTAISDGFVGGTVEASGIGPAVNLRLVMEGKIYFLPVIESSIVLDDATGIWTALFATVDPVTSQPLVPAGVYQAGCFGSGGTADGSGVFKVTIK